MPELKHEKDFKIEEYDSFYEHHFFNPLEDSTAVNAHRLIPRVGWAVDKAKELKPKRVLDLGCLEGFTALTLANNVESVERAVGVDLSQEGIDLANSRKQLVEADVEFYKDSIEHFLETTDEKFDFICLFEVIEHVKDPAKLLKLIDRVKTEDAHILISTPDFEAPTFGKDDEKNKCHIRLYTLADEDYEAVNKYGNTRKATSMSKQVGKERIIEIGTYSELINCMIK
jgi:2-polyprenyl-3-methyl-5-hydroxy-6-metoxy-1,4-benzoquinol methylase